MHDGTSFALARRRGSSTPLLRVVRGKGLLVGLALLCAFQTQHRCISAVVEVASPTCHMPGSFNGTPEETREVACSSALVVPCTVLVGLLMLCCLGAEVLRGLGTESGAGVASALRFCPSRPSNLSEAALWELLPRLARCLPAGSWCWSHMHHGGDGLKL